ncbi:hypothetical protein L1987_19249 [Smallanthus sonchifolius]|uniref:Uncharacterized protein n=1 Tax=Smallanthus sonchifolius TaxID=185202 RepID=A0ACB9IRG4_9ASTR|nr:hypothetical protein L1987_19249 [Smallanthus sonchifolius]
MKALFLQFSSHGLQTGIFEARKIVLINVAPSLRGVQVQSVASFFSTILGTTIRIPCEVLKQRLQARIFNNVGGSNHLHITTRWSQRLSSKFWEGDWNHGRRL